MVWRWTKNKEHFSMVENGAVLVRETMEMFYKFHYRKKIIHMNLTTKILTCRHSYCSSEVIFDQWRSMIISNVGQNQTSPKRHCRQNAYRKIRNRPFDCKLCVFQMYKKNLMKQTSYNNSINLSNFKCKQIFFTSYLKFSLCDSV